MTDDAFAKLENAFRKQVENDNKKYAIDSIYLPNARVCNNPLFCLISMEPSVGRKGVAGTREAVNYGFKNFLTSEVAYIFHYCVYTYLCNGNFLYHLTDISKGAMKTTTAAAFRRERYAEWKCLLDQELKQLSNPNTIAIGLNTAQNLQRLGMDISHSIPHFSWSASDCIKSVYKSQFEKQFPLDTLGDVQRKLNIFRELLLTHIKYDERVKINEKKIKFNINTSRWKQRLFIIYREQFKTIARTLKQ